MTSTIFERDRLYKSRSICSAWRTTWCGAGRGDRDRFI